MRYLAFLLLIFSLKSVGAVNPSDSLLLRIRSNPDDKQKLEDYHQLFSIKVNESLDSAFQIAQSELALAKELNTPSGIGRALNHIGLYYDYLGDFSQARSYYQQGLDAYTSISDSLGMAQSFMNLGIIRYLISDLDGALVKYHHSLSIAESHGDSALVSNLCNNIGIILQDLGKYFEALKYFSRSLKYETKQNNKSGMAGSYNNMGICYKLSGNLDEAITYYERALALWVELEKPEGIAKVKSNIGRVYHAKESYDRAIKYAMEALETERTTNNLRGMAGSYVNLGESFMEQKRYALAEEYFKNGLKIAQNLQSKEYISSAHNSLSILYNRMKAFEKAFHHLELTKIYEDSIINEASAQKIIELEGKYEFENQNRRIDSLNQANLYQSQMHAAKVAQDKKERDSEHKRNQLILTSGLIILLIVLIAIFLIWRQSLKRKHINIQLARQKTLVDKKNQNITDSITYAKRIQSALIRNENSLSKTFTDHFIFYKPKDIVSGDFYWTKVHGNKCLVAVADCTGHGVPGALMSMLGVAFLSEITSDIDSFDTAEILGQLRQKIITELGQKGGRNQSQDGMDISLVSIDLSSYKAQWSGAFNPIWIVRKSGDQTVEELKGDHQPVGFYHGMEPFSQHSLSFQPGDQIYLFSDGFSDQFGGEKGKKFRSSRFKALIQNIAHLSMSEQNKALTEQFDSWKTGHEQLDDVCVVGLRI